MKDIDLYEKILISKDIVFKPLAFCRNFDMFTIDDSFVQNISGEINETNIAERALPTLIGEFTINIYNVSLANYFGANIIDEFELNAETSIINNEIFKVVKNGLDINKYNKIIYINNLIFVPNRRGYNIVDEFIEFVFRTYYTMDTLILFYVKPFQYIHDDFNYFSTIKTVDIRNNIKTKSYKKISANLFYGLDGLKNNESDEEIETYKIYSIASRNGLHRIDNSDIFEMRNIEKILKRIKQKKELVEANDMLNNPTLI